MNQFVKRIRATMINHDNIRFVIIWKRNQFRKINLPKLAIFNIFHSLFWLSVYMIIWARNMYNDCRIFQIAMHSVEFWAYFDKMISSMFINSMSGWRAENISICSKQLILTESTCEQKNKYALRFLQKQCLEVIMNQHVSNFYFGKPINSSTNVVCTSIIMLCFIINHFWKCRLEHLWNYYCLVLNNISVRI